jgi:hypothetical protein
LMSPHFALPESSRWPNPWATFQITPLQWTLPIQNSRFLSI